MTNKSLLPVPATLIPMKCLPMDMQVYADLGSTQKHTQNPLFCSAGQDAFSCGKV